MTDEMKTDPTALPVVIVGAGISGLTAAYRLSCAGIPFLCIDGSERAGGNIETAAHDGFLYDLGPDSFLKTKRDGASLCEEVGLAGEMISPRPGASLVHVARDGVLYPMPEGLSLGVPKRPGPLFATELLSPEAKLRALLEPFIKRPSDVGEETIFGFLSRRLGAEMAERLAAPLLSGVFAGDATRLSMNAAFPQLVQLEKKYGSLFAGLNGGKSIWQVLRDESPAAESPFVSLRRGLGSLVERLLELLPPGALRLRERVVSVTPPTASQPLLVATSSGEIAARHVIFAGPPWAAGALLGSLHKEMDAALRAVRGFQTATVFFGLDERLAQPSFEGSGFIVPPGEAEILASTFISSKWDHRAPPQKALVRAFVGGARKDISSLTNGELQKLAHQELTRLLGHLGPILFSRVHRYERGTPQPELGYEKLLASVFDAVDQMPWLSLVGSGYGGVGIPDCIRQANEAAARLISDSP